MPTYEIRQEVKQTLVKIVDADHPLHALSKLEEPFKDTSYTVEDRTNPTKVTITLIKE